MMLPVSRRRLITAVGIAAVLLTAVAAYLVRGDEATIPIETAVSDARARGFDLVVWRATAAEREAARRAFELAHPAGDRYGGFSGDGTVAVTRGQTFLDLDQTLMIVWLPSSAAAAKRIENDLPLLNNQLTSDERRLLPKNFDVSRLSDVQACNLAITSYDAGSDDSLPQRFQDLASAS
jgi:hypothetical protein